jgi:hypothetical protein
MIVTLTEFATLARDQNGFILPLGSKRLVCQELAGAGPFIALQKTTRFVRLASDTGIRVYIDGAYYGFFPPGGVEFKAIDTEGVIVSITAAA